MACPRSSRWCAAALVVISSSGAVAGCVTTPAVHPLAAPSGLSASATASNQIDLAWTDNVSNEDGFRIERRQGQTGAFEEIATVGPNVTTYSDRTLSPGIEYCYRIAAFNSSGNSTYSAIPCATTPTIPPVSCGTETQAIRTIVVELLTSSDSWSTDWRTAAGLLGADPNDLVLVTADSVCHQIWVAVSRVEPEEEDLQAFYKLGSCYIVTDYPSDTTGGRVFTSVVDESFNIVGFTLVQ